MRSRDDPMPQCRVPGVGQLVDNDPWDTQVHRDPLLCPWPIYLASNIPQGDFFFKKL